MTARTVGDIDNPSQMCVRLSIVPLSHYWACSPPCELPNASPKVLRCFHYGKKKWLFLESTQKQWTQITMETMGPHTCSHQEPMYHCMWIPGDSATVTRMMKWWHFSRPVNHTWTPLYIQMLDIIDFCVGKDDWPSACHLTDWLVCVFVTIISNRIKFPLKKFKFRFKFLK